jgi:hypothetical protein
MSTTHEHEGHNHGDHADYYARRAEAIQQLLIEKGVCTLNEILTMADQIDSRSPEDGARIVARAWVDPEFKKRLIADPEATIEELGLRLPETAPRLRILENTDKVTTWAALGWLSTLGASCVSSARSWTTRWRFALWTAAPICATSSYPNARKAPKI